MGFGYAEPGELESEGAVYVAEDADDLYEYLIKLVERKIIECKNHYKHQEYPEIATIYNETKKKLNEELISYGILNSESNDINKTETVR